MEMIFDLPAHPLLVHFPVVAIPVLTLLGVVMVIRPRVREPYALPVLVFAVATVVVGFALLSLVWTVRTGHEGAKAVWGSSVSSDETGDDSDDLAGQQVYEANCARCHGTDGGGGRGPNLQGLAIDDFDRDDAREQVIEGGNGMPAFGARLDDAQIAAAIDYIYASF